MKNFWKLLNIWWSYQSYKMVPVFGPTCRCVMVHVIYQYLCKFFTL